MKDDRRDTQLLEAWALGDADAGGELLRRHFETVYRFFATKIDVHIDDLVQRTLVGAMEGRQRIRSPSRFRAYLLGIARYQLIGFLRERGVKATQVLDRPVLDAAPTPTSILAARHEHRLLLRALRRLPLRLQIVVGLYYFDGLKVDEIAEVTAAPSGTVKDRLARARRCLREAMQAAAADQNATWSTLTGFETWRRGVPDSERDGRARGGTRPPSRTAR